MAEGVGVADRMALLELHARYATTIDEGDADAWAACFTSDGVLRTSRPLRVEGRAALAAFAADWHASTAGRSRHMTWHHRFEPDGAEVAGTCYAALVRTVGARVELDFTATYEDRFAATAAGWLIRERFVTIDRAVSH
jgi:ketosteroid isomerase-like protein